jgi:glycosyltransferase involved in cell wall biosynthesis
LRYRMLIVNHAVEMGGAEMVLLSFLDHMGEAFEPALACPHEGPLVEEMRKRGIRVHLGYPSPRLLEIKRRSLGASRLYPLLYPYDMAVTVLRLARLVRREGYQLVFTNSAKADVYGSMAGWLAARPVVWRLHDIPDTRAFSRLNLQLLRWCASLLAHRVLAISGAVRDALVALGVPPARVKVVHNGVDPRSAGLARRGMREEWGIPEEAPLVGMVGRLVDWKGPDVFIRAAALVARDIPQARFVLVGEAIFGSRDYVRGLKEISASLGLGESLVFTGFVEDVMRAMDSMDLLVHASILPEPFGMVLTEAMAAGLPVVATIGGGVGEIVEDGVTGLLVPPGDPAAMAAAVKEIISRPDRGVEMGEAGRRRVADRFDIREKAREMEAELPEVVRNQAGRWSRVARKARG